jgi:hypothetical protein
MSNPPTRDGLCNLACSGGGFEANFAGTRVQGMQRFPSRVKTNEQQTVKE